MTISKPALYFFLFINSLLLSAQPVHIAGADIEHFWLAYDKITATTDTVLQKKYLQEIYLDNATPGLEGLIQVKRYTDKQLLDAINNYPKFWQSIRANTVNYKRHFPEITANIEQLRALYPALKNSNIYFTIGAFRSGGTIYQDRVLISCELSLADKNSIISELPAWRQPFYQEYNPINDIGLLCTHEYIHTQQKEPEDNLISYCLYEGVAEFFSCLATHSPSNTPAVAFGKENRQKVMDKFAHDLFFYRLSDWMWGENTNELKVRDLGYYVGYEMCERYYNAASDKQKAIRELIELDYSNAQEVARIVDATKILPTPLQQLSDDYERKRPYVVNVSPLKKKKKIKPGIVQLAIHFSTEMDPEYRGFDYGPLGEKHIYQFKRLIGWSNNNKTLTLEVEVAPDQKIQTYITTQFRSKEGVRLKPFLIDFETKKR